MKEFNVLIACEESQVECIAFRDMGCNAFSCDLQMCSGGHPEWHVMGDVLSILNPPCTFVTCDGVSHTVAAWDLVIAHPPCTYITRAGAQLLFPGGVLDSCRFSKLSESVDFFYNFLNCNAKRVCIENPIPVSVARLPNYNQLIQPYQFGEYYSKSTCLWLKGLPLLMSTDYVGSNVPSYVYSVSGSVKRSKSFNGIARAMANQWAYCDVYPISFDSVPCYQLFFEVL